ncbi:hypothetical protein Pla111_14210 [Botrimarina hoheduenensis]|uniref:Uncharacterized protein n=1 Tax=Botrimarina hoheduenensis TaxID=2528000 RepID=A0A5C5WA78_9BACT|nr:hypothetical protein Pla111_14210 [Botrimarina hoheduenensis]
MSRGNKIPVPEAPEWPAEMSRKNARVGPAA